ncbi:hypothetical protein E2C01_005786 [Portunus trituberculatus]|uniref:Uncharacterized protein n=1 Tax=Portunus trituberculatus TaxID=210409 RepID=A0A5B7CTA9_PORTR|nr:hypothetical protein [Portunus trituberculatus]
MSRKASFPVLSSTFSRPMMLRHCDNFTCIMVLILAIMSAKPEPLFLPSSPSSSSFSLSSSPKLSSSLSPSSKSSSISSESSL